MSGTGNELALREETAPALRVPALPDLPDVDSWIRAMASIAKLAEKICETSFVPRGLRGDDAAVTAAILTGRELGLGPMAALRHIHVVEGVPSLDAEYKRSKVLAAGHMFRIIEWDDEHCKVAARRKNETGTPLVMEYTMKMARRAGLVKDRGNYITRPEVMMVARVTTLVTNAIFPDVTNGLATTELLESGDADAIADALGSSFELPAIERPKVTADQIRARAVTAGTQNVPPAQAAATPIPAAGSASPVAGAGGTRPYAELLGFISDRLGLLGVEDAADKLRAVQLIAGSKVKSLRGLTPEEAVKVADTLEAIEGPGPDGLLADLATAGDPREDGGQA